MSLWFGLAAIVVLLWFIAHSLGAIVDHLAGIRAQLERTHDDLPDQIADAVDSKFSWRIEEIHVELMRSKRHLESMNDHLHSISISALDTAQASGG